MYDQTVDDSIARRKGNTLSVTGARISIIPHSNLLSAKISTHPSQLSTETEKLSLIFQNTLTGDVSETIYDAIVCATGYERHSWLDLLKSSGIGKRFGLTSASDKTCLAVERDMGVAMNGKNDNSLTLNSGLNTNGVPQRVPYPYLETNVSGTLPTSPSRSKYFSPDIMSMTDTLYISRRYRLLPLQTAGRGFVPRIYLQGCAEETHGLSETLLSVTGVKAGEVVEDLCSNR